MSEDVSEADLHAQRFGYRDEDEMNRERLKASDKNPDNWGDDGRHVSEMNREDRRRLAKRNRRR